MSKNTDIQEKLVEKIIFDLIEVTEANSIFETSCPTNIVHDILNRYQKANNLTDKARRNLCLRMARKSRELTELLYSTCYALIEADIDTAHLIAEYQIHSVIDKKQFFTTDEVLKMSSIFNIKTKNTLVTKLNEGEINGKKVNNKWQITRQALIDFVGHDNF